MPVHGTDERAENEDTIKEAGAPRSRMLRPGPPKAAVIVAHPDDETLWAGGLILCHPAYQWFIAALSRKSDPDRSPRFSRVLKKYNAKGTIADLEDGPRQDPLPVDLIQKQILGLLPAGQYELLVTHAPAGEYTRHRRHEEVSRAVIDLWQSGRISARALYLFAYADDQGKSLPHAVAKAHRVDALPEATCRQKYDLITEVYGFLPGSWEARTTPRVEAFWCFDSPTALRDWLREMEEH